MEYLAFDASETNNGRIGNLRLRQAEISTPLLLPVVCMMTGTTARGGGLWKYVLHADTSNGLLRRNLPVMTQVLHFLDFSSATPKALAKWRETGLRGRYNNEVSPPLDYTGPLFLDSGGFKLLWNNTLDLSSYGLSVRGANAPHAIVELQKDLGGDIIATLDYPLPLGLASSEAKERMQKSLDNAVSAALYLQENSEYQPFLYVAAHGQDRDSIGQYAQMVFRRFSENGLKAYPFGLAVGSLVPLRGAKKYPIIINLLRGLLENIPSEMRRRIPIHIFGITGNLVPVLAYLGIDSFDSSTYVQEARSLGYIDPKTGRIQPVLEMETWTCKCRVCRELSLPELQEAFTSEIRNRPLPTGHFKSKYYGDVALHNLEMDFRIVDETRQAIEADSLQDYLIHHVERFPALRPALDTIAMEDDELQVRLSRTVLQVPRIEQTREQVEFISLDYTPDSFNINRNGYNPPRGKQILLIIPCSGGKPYSDSRSHRLVAARLAEALGGRESAVHKVTLSGLYGPVPEEYENEASVMGYDFRLETSDPSQIALVASRLAEYVERFSFHYKIAIAYATSRAYRTALELAADRVPSLHILPAKPKTRRLTEFFRRENVAELQRAIWSALSDTQSKSSLE